MLEKETTKGERSLSLLESATLQLNTMCCSCSWDKNAFDDCGSSWLLLGRTGRILFAIWRCMCAILLLVTLSLAWSGTAENDDLGKHMHRISTWSAAGTALIYAPVAAFVSVAALVLPPEPLSLEDSPRWKRIIAAIFAQSFETCTVLSLLCSVAIAFDENDTRAGYRALALAYLVSELLFGFISFVWSHVWFTLLVSLVYCIVHIATEATHGFYSHFSLSYLDGFGTLMGRLSGYFFALLALHICLWFFTNKLVPRLARMRKRQFDRARKLSKERRRREARSGGDATEMRRRNKSGGAKDDDDSDDLESGTDSGGSGSPSKSERAQRTSIAVAPGLEVSHGVNTPEQGRRLESSLNRTVTRTKSRRRKAAAAQPNDLHRVKTGVVVATDKDLPSTFQNWIKRKDAADDDDLPKHIHFTHRKVIQTEDSTRSRRSHRRSGEMKRAKGEEKEKATGRTRGSGTKRKSKLSGATTKEVVADSAKISSEEEKERQKDASMVSPELTDSTELVASPTLSSDVTPVRMRNSGLLASPVQQVLASPDRRVTRRAGRLLATPNSDGGDDRHASRTMSPRALSPRTLSPRSVRSLRAMSDEEEMPGYSRDRGDSMSADDSGDSETEDELVVLSEWDEEEEEVEERVWGEEEEAAQGASSSSSMRDVSL